MASDKQIESHHRKHHRSSSPDEPDKSSKRHKHRHHKHHHKRHHRHHRGDNRDDEIPSGGDETEVKDDVSLSLADPIGVSNGGEDEVEEGEILEEEEGLSERGKSQERDIERDSEGRRRRERDSDRKREREREKRKEIDYERRREKERERSIEGDRRWERGDRDNGRVRSRDRIRYDSRERRREKERESDKDRNRGRDIQADRERHRSRDFDYGETRHRESRHSRYDAVDDRETGKPNSVKVNGEASEETWGNDERSRKEDDQDDNEEVAMWGFPEEEEDEINRIKEESRKRREAILEKYKKKTEQQIEPASQDNREGAVKETSAPEVTSSEVAIAANVGQHKAKLELNTDVAKASLTAGAPPILVGISDSQRTLAAGGLGEGSPKSEGSADMFHDDIFGDSPAGNLKVGRIRGKDDGVPMVRSGLNDNWDDAEGYYSYQFGELLDGRYEVIATHGKGVFSTVVRAKDLKAGPTEPEEVAIKIIRNNETMHKAGQTEVQILKKLAGADREDRRHCVRFLTNFKYRNHLCLVFESLHLNLREVLKKFGRNIGLKLSAVRAYSKQLFIALKHLKNCGVLHCDIKPDNMLVNENKNVLKLCDFGNAMFAGKNEVTPYLVSRFYRSPEIILGLAYDHPLDIWSVGCCLYELYSGKVLFPGATNNDMLRLHMELKGPFPKKMLRKGAFIDQHFDHDLNFYATEEDTVSGKMIKRMIVNVKPKDFGSIIKGYTGEDPKMLAHFRDLLDKMFILDPERRLTVSQALAHPFITGK